MPGESTNNKKIERILKKSYFVTAAILVLLAVAAYIYFTRYFDTFHDPKKIKIAIMAYGDYSMVAFLVMQAMQVIVFFIPGEVVQIAGGYIFGTFYGSIYSLAGIMAGSVLAYGTSRLFGKPLIKKIISEKHLDFFERALSLGSINYVVFLLYLIPGIPKDVLAYICGISDIKFVNFMLCSILGRIPAIVVSAYFGAGLGKGQGIVLTFIAVFMVILFIIGVFKGEKLIKKLVKRDES